MSEINKKKVESKVETLKKELSDLEALLKEPVKSKEDLMEEIFLSLIQNSRYEIKDGNNIWYNSNNNWIIQQDKKTKKIWFSYEKFWSIFESKFNLNYQEIRNLFSDLLVKHFDLNGYTLKYWK